MVHDSRVMLRHDRAVHTRMMVEALLVGACAELSEDSSQLVPTLTGRCALFMRETLVRRHGVHLSTVYSLMSCLALDPGQLSR